MKRSRVPWLGEVPDHWDVKRVAHIGRLLKGVGGTKEDAAETGLPCVRYGDLYTTHNYFIRDARSKIAVARTPDYTEIKFGDVLFAASGETVDDIGKSAVNLIREPAFCGGDVIVLRPTIPLHAPFMGYAADCEPSVAQKATMARGTTVKHVYPDQLKWLFLCVPPIPEQAAIVRFLDHVERRIRRHIHAKQKLIKLLEEQKQAIIHHAVTRGLNPNVRLKPSGVEWIGDVPEHWEVRSFTRSAVERADYRGATPTKTESGVFLVTAKNIRKGWIDYEASREFVSQGDYSTIMRRGLPQVGDLLLTTEAPLGNAALVDKEDVALAQRVIRFRMDSDLFKSSFALHAVLSPYFQRQLIQRGTGSTAIGIKASKLPQLQILRPPLPEQMAILDWIDRECAPLDTTTAAARLEIDLLREFRRRLIADVVTGKLDVREAAARLPEEVEEPELLDETETLADVEGISANDELDADAEQPEEADA